MMQRAERHAVVSIIGAANLLNRQYVRRLKQAELHTTHRAAVPVGVQHPASKLGIADRAACFNNFDSAIPSDSRRNVGNSDSVRVFADLLQNRSLTGHCTRGMERTKILDIRRSKIRAKCNGYFAIALLARRKAPNLGRPKGCLRNLKGG
jgi:hypothetical protein